MSSLGEARHRGGAENDLFICAFVLGRGRVANARLAPIGVDGTAAVDIEAWLRELGLERYARAFGENAIDARSLPHLTGDDSRSWGSRPSVTAGSSSRPSPISKRASVPSLKHAHRRSRAPRRQPQNRKRSGGS